MAVGSGLDGAPPWGGNGPVQFARIASARSRLRWRCARLRQARRSPRLPQARNYRGDVLQLEKAVQRPGRERIAVAPADPRGEAQAQRPGRRPDARQADPTGFAPNKMVTPAARRAWAAWGQEAFHVSKLRFCQAAGAHRGLIAYRSRKPPQAALRARRRELAQARVSSAISGSTRWWALHPRPEPPAGLRLLVVLIRGGLPPPAGLRFLVVLLRGCPSPVGVIRC